MLGLDSLLDSKKPALLGFLMMTSVCKLLKWKVFWASGKA